MAAEVDRGLIQRALLNLLLNAADATGDDGRIRVELRRDVADFRQAVIEVHDDGPGVGEERREEIFNAFHTTKEDGTGARALLGAQRRRGTRGRGPGHRFRPGRRLLPVRFRVNAQRGKE